MKMVRCLSVQFAQPRCSSLIRFKFIVLSRFPSQYIHTHARTISMISFRSEPFLMNSNWAVHLGSSDCNGVGANGAIDHSPFHITREDVGIPLLQWLPMIFNEWQRFHSGLLVTEILISSTSVPLHARNHRGSSLLHGQTQNHKQIITLAYFTKQVRPGCDYLIVAFKGVEGAILKGYTYTHISNLVS